MCWPRKRAGVLVCEVLTDSVQKNSCNLTCNLKKMQTNSAPRASNQ